MSTEDKKPQPPLLGSQYVKSTPKNTPREDFKAGLTPSSPVIAGQKRAEAKETTSEVPEVSAEEKKSARIKAYLDNLEKLAITHEQARFIIDEVLFKGFYSESFRLMNRITVKLKTRSYADLMRTNRMLEVDAPRIPMHFNDLLVRYNLAASLVQYESTEFPILPVVVDGGNGGEAQAQLFQSKLDFIQQLPLQIVVKLTQILHEFDEKTFAVFEEGAPEDF